MQVVGLRVFAVAALLGGMALPVRADLLDFVEVQFDGQAGVDGLNGASSVAVSPDGRNVYVAGVGDDAVAVFSRNAGSGRLAFVEVQKDGEKGVSGLSSPTALAVSPDGMHVYVASLGALAVFSRSNIPTTGTLSFVEAQFDGENGVSGVALPQSVVVSPDNPEDPQVSHVYVASSEGALATFQRDTSSGKLTFIEALRDQQDGVEGLAGAQSVAVSPNGLNVYVTGFFANAVAVFGRTPSSGRLTFIEEQVDQQGGVEGLQGPESVAVSSDGAHVYVASSESSTLTAFTRSAATGKLSFVEAEVNGEGGVEGIEGAVSVEPSPDGAYVYVASSVDSAVAAFRRDADTGRLSFVEAKFNGQGGVDGLGGAQSVTVSADGAQVYAAGSGEGAVAVFQGVPPPTATRTSTTTPTSTVTATNTRPLSPTSTMTPIATTTSASSGEGGAGCRIANEPHPRPSAWSLALPLLALWGFRWLSRRKG